MLMFFGIIFFLASMVFAILAIVFGVKKDKRAKKFGLLTVASFVLFMVMAINDDSEPAEKAIADTPPPVEVVQANAAKAVEPVPVVEVAPQTLEEQVKASIIKAIGEQSNMKKERISNIYIVDDKVREGAKVAEIVLNASENITTNMTKTGMLMDSSKVFQPLFAIPELNDISLSWQLPLVDAYGAEKDGVVLIVRLKRDTAEKINWKNFITDNYPKIAEHYFEHPAIKK